jgi:predicted aconitase with swiveling domain
VFSRPAHKLVGLSYVGRILVLDTAKGGVASAWMLNEMRSRDMVPLAIVFNSVNPILVQGAALGDITMLAGFDADITAIVPHGAMVEVDPQAKTLRVLGQSEGLAHREGDTTQSASPGEPRKVRFVGRE